MNELRCRIVRSEEVGVRLNVTSRRSGSQCGIGERSIGLESLRGVREDWGTMTQGKRIAKRPDRETAGDWGRVKGCDA
jgi:hypothetical protein